MDRSLIDEANAHQPSIGKRLRVPAVLAGVAVVGLMVTFGGGNPFGGSPGSFGGGTPIQVPALVPMDHWNDMAHWELVSVGDRLPMDSVRVNQGNVFFGRISLSDSYEGWDYQVAEIETNDKSVVTEIRTGDVIPTRAQGEVLIARNHLWLPSTQGDVVPSGAVTFMKNPSDGPCFVARTGSSACKLNAEENAAWNFRYIASGGTHAAQSGDILIVLPGGGGSPGGGAPIQEPAQPLSQWNHMAHWELVSVGDRLPMDCIRVNQGNVFFGRVSLSDSYEGWDYQVAEIETNDRSVVLEIRTADTIPTRAQGEVLIARNHLWLPSRRGDVVPSGAVTFMTNPSDGPCVIARSGSSACKLNTEDNAGYAAWNFRYIASGGTTAVQSGDIFIVH